MYANAITAHLREQWMSITLNPYTSMSCIHLALRLDSTLAKTKISVVLFRETLKTRR
jgi:hypothetical protein